MKITMIRNAAKSLECPLKEGESGEVPDELAHTLIGMHVAVLFTRPEKLKGVSPDPALTGQSSADKSK